jgi:DNA-directed RNA polymerase specialized sigma24 family protein
MISDAIEKMVRYIHNFDPTKSENAFAYFTQFAYNAFIQRINFEKKQQYIKAKVSQNTFFEMGDESHYGMTDDVQSKTIFDFENKNKV